jgi:exopolysaccharide biosynthesis polyprenyl glycosylphosphotransferase
MRSNEEYKRIIKLLFSSVMIFGVSAIYTFVWVCYYNRHIIQVGFYRRGNWVMVLLYSVLLMFFLNTYGGFKVGYLKSGNLIYSQVLAVFFTNTITYFQIALVDKRFVTPTYMILMTLVDIIFIIIWTLSFQMFYKWLFPPRKILLVSGERSDYNLLEKINARDDKYEICKVISYQIGYENIIKVIESYDGVIIGDMPSHDRNLILKYCFQQSIRSYSIPKISDIILRSSDEMNLFDSPLLLSRNIGLTLEQQFLKRLLDIVVSVLGIIICSPVFLILMIGIKLSDGGPAFYSQSRLTINGKVFMIYKFRTMIQEAELESGPRLAGQRDDRILPIGRLLRATRLDELPQLFNILKGEMSLVGPRPERPELAEEITKEIPEFAYRLKVKAGLTGYAQIYGKYNTTSYDKLKLDLTYIRNYSFLLDLKLIIMTPKVLFMKESTEGIKL